MMGSGGQEETKEKGYSRLAKIRVGVILALALATVAVALVTLTVDLGSLSFSDVIYIIFHKNDPSVSNANRILVWDIYMPRIACGILAGFALGVSGAVMQCVLRNPLGSPYTLGISNAAAFGASVGIVLNGGAIIGQSHASVVINNPYIVTACAFIMAMIGTGIIVLLVTITKVDANTMVLAGVAISSIFAAGISALQYIYNEYALSAIVFWQFGSLGKATWDELKIVAVVVIPIILYFIWKRWDFNALDNGADVARSLGVNVDSLRLVTMVLAALMTAVVVSFMGIIAFIGLLGPHMVRLILGNDHRYLIPGSMFLGTIILLIADCFGQSMFSFTLPVGIITSFLGGPLFLFILIKGYKKGAMP